MAETTTPTKRPRGRPKKTTSVSTVAVPAVRNPYADIAKTKQSATYNLFRENLWSTFDNLDEEGMEKLLQKYGTTTTWIYVSVRSIADAIAQIPFQVVQEREDGQPNRPVRGYDLGLIKLLRQPNPFQRRFDFVEAAFTCLELTGNCFIELVRDKQGTRPIEMYILNPSRMTVIPDRKDFVKGYVYSVNGRYVAFEKEDIIHIKYYHPSNDYYGLSPLTAARLATEVDQAALEWNHTFLLRGAWPAGAIESEHDLGDDEVKRLRRMIKQTMMTGKDQAGRLLLLTGGLKYNALAIKPKDTDWIDARRMARDEILSIFKVPFAIAGLFSTEQTTARSAGVEQQIKQFYRSTIFPKVEKFLEALNRELVPWFREKYEIVPNYRSVPALQDEVDQELTRAQALQTLVTAGVSLNKALARLYPDIQPEEWGEAFFCPQTMVAITGKVEGVVAPELIPPDPVAPKAVEGKEPKKLPAPKKDDAEKAMFGLGEEWDRITARVRGSN